MNQAINFFWTILSFIPVVAFWIGTGLTVEFYVFAGISIISLFLPARVLQLSNDPKFYERLGVKFIRRFVQNGDLINRFIRKGNSQHKLVKDRAHAIKYMRTIIMYERYHFLCFIFFLLTAGYALVNTQYAFAALIILADLIYNICPILLQQYNRARVSRLIK